MVDENDAATENCVAFEMLDVAPNSSGNFRYVSDVLVVVVVVVGVSTAAAPVGVLYCIGSGI